MSYVVYVLQSLASGRLYIGHTNDLERRLHEHATGQSAYTRGRGPWELIYQVSFSSRSEAVRHELWLKGLKSRTRILEYVGAR